MKRKHFQRLGAWFLSLALCLSLLPTAAFAAGTDTGKAIQFVDSGTAANISGGQADNIYFGIYQQSSDGNSGYNTDPIKWRVLENANSELFLLSDQNLDVFQYHTEEEGVTWETSTMRSWLNGYGAKQNTGGDSGNDYTDDNFIDTAFSDEEQGAIANTTVVNADNGSADGGNDTTDKIFLLSIAEAQNSSYFADNNSRIATNTAYVADGGKNSGNMFGVGAADYWWLRSPGDLVYSAAGVFGTGGVITSGHIVNNDDYAVRPAFHLDLTSVLFTSAATGGKPDGGLQAVEDYTGNEWKLTLKDESRNFAVSNAATNGENTIGFFYSGAQAGENEYISAVIEDSGTITHYGRILQLDGATNGASGIARLTLPEGVTLSDTTKLYVFNEQYKGGENDDTKLTDYASQLIEISNPVADTTAPTLTKGEEATRDSETAATVKFNSSEAGEYYYAVVDDGAAEPEIDTTEAGTSCDTTEQTISLDSLTAGAKDIYIVAKDAAGNVSEKLKIEIPAYVAPQPVEYTIIFDGNSGTSPAAQTTTGGKLTSLPTSTLAGYTFNGWYTAKTGGEKITLDTVFSVSATVYAQWTKNSEGGGTSRPAYRPDVEDTVNGDVTVQPSNPHKGDEVIITPKPEDGYEVEDVIVTDRDGEPVNVTDNGDGTWTFTQPGGRVTVEVIFRETPPEPLPFNDVPEGAWYYDAVRYVYEHGLMNGTSATTFSPEGTTSRGQIVTILWRVAGSPDMEGEIWGYPFADVDATAYYGTAVYWARMNGIAGGYGDGTFGPDDPISREQFAAMLYRFAQERGYDVTASADLSGYADVDKVSGYALEAMRWANAEGIINGTSGATLTPQGQATRAQAAAMLMRFCERAAA